jgi:hypothetical protein
MAVGVLTAWDCVVERSSVEAEVGASEGIATNVRTEGCYEVISRALNSTSIGAISCETYGTGRPW